MFVSAMNGSRYGGELHVVMQPAMWRRASWS
jgi:hypothetical protein